MRSGTVLSTVGGVYRVLLDDGDRVDASLRGRLKREKRTGSRVVAGDRVAVARGKGDSWTVEGVSARRTELVRAGPGGRRPKVIAANLDQVLVVVAAADPAPDAHGVDRFLVLCEVNGIPPLLVFNKMDVPGARDVVEPLEAVYGEIGYSMLETSAESGRGLEHLRAAMSGRTSAMVGPSGVGKSSLLNALQPGLELRTRSVSRRGGRGRHTTVSARLLVLDDGMRIVDTPGFSDVNTWGVSPGDLAGAFPEFEEPAEDCRFRGCTHIHEPDCGVLRAVEEGRIDAGRFESYRRLLEESEAA
ncbi:MAG: ribosome small subunit-dependent GTPase A [Acidobacteriota bacterium]